MYSFFVEGWRWKWTLITFLVFLPPWCTGINWPIIFTNNNSCLEFDKAKWFLKHWPSGPMLSISRFVRYLPPLPKVWCPKFSEIQNPWGGKWKEVVSDLRTFTNKGCKLPGKNNFLGEFCIPELDFFGLVFLTPFSGLFCPHSPKSNVQTF